MQFPPGKHAVSIYVTLTVLVSWGMSAVVIGPRAFPLSWERFETLGGEMYAAFLAGPVVAGLTMIGLVDGRAGFRDLLARLGRWRVGARNYALALVPAAVLAIVALLLGLVVPSFRPAILTDGATASMVLPGIALSLLFGFFEELGWTGFAIPKLLRHHDAVTTGVVIGLVWGAWHFPLFWRSDSFSGPVPAALLFAQLFSWLPAFRILMVRMYERTNSLVVPVIMHASLVMTQLILLPRALSESAWLAHIAIWAVVVWTLVITEEWSCRADRPHGVRAR